MRPAVNVVALATAVPPHLIEQEAAAERASLLFGRDSAFEHLRPVFANCGIRRRYAAVPLDWFAQPRSWPERNRVYATTALDLLERVAGLALDRGGAAADEVGAIVVVSTTGIATPSLDALLIERMALPRTVQRLPIFGLGCGGGAIGLARAAALAAAMPDKTVLLLVVELCTLWFRSEPSKSNIVGASLFGDGAAAVLLRTGGDGPAIAAVGEHTWPATLDLMGWDVAEDGLQAIFSREIPALVAAELRGAVRLFLESKGLRLADIDRFVCHPGGPKVIAACEGALGLESGTLADERGVLRDFGNMSAATVLFVLERSLARAKSWKQMLMTAFGPGFTAGFVVLERR